MARLPALGALIASSTFCSLFAAAPILSALPTLGVAESSFRPLTAPPIATFRQRQHTNQNTRCGVDGLAGLRLRTERVKPKPCQRVIAVIKNLVGVKPVAGGPAARLNRNISQAMGKVGIVSEQREGWVGDRLTEITEELTRVCAQKGRSSKPLSKTCCACAADWFSLKFKRLDLWRRVSRRVIDTWATWARGNRCWCPRLNSVKFCPDVFVLAGLFVVLKVGHQTRLL